MDCFVTSFPCCCFKRAWWKLWTIQIKKPLNKEQAFLSRAALYWKIHCDMRAFMITVWEEIIFVEWLRWFCRGVHYIKQLTNQSRPPLWLIHWIKSFHIRLTSVIDLVMENKNCASLAFVQSCKKSCSTEFAIVDIAHVHIARLLLTRYTVQPFFCPKIRSRAQTGRKHRGHCILKLLFGGQFFYSQMLECQVDAK